MPAVRATAKSLLSTMSRLRGPCHQSPTAAIAVDDLEGVVLNGGRPVTKVGRHAGKEAFGYCMGSMYPAGISQSSPDMQVNVSQGGKLWMLPDKAVRNIQMQNAVSTRGQIEKFLREVVLLQSLTDEERSKVRARSHPIPTFFRGSLRAVIAVDALCFAALFCPWTAS